MTLPMTTPFTDPDLNGAIHRFVTRNRFLDHAHQFRSGDDATIRTAAHILVSHESDLPDSVPFAISGHPVVHISLTDTTGARFALQDCAEVSGSVHAFGILHHDAERGETWLLKSPVPPLGLVTADAVGGYEVLRLAGISESGAEDIALRDGVFCQGEFYHSDGPDPVLVACAWHTTLGEFAPGFETPQKVDADRRTQEAARARIAQMRTPDLVGA